MTAPEGSKLYEQGGIYVDARVSVSWFGLGSGLAEQLSTDQQAFLVGLADKFSRMGHDGNVQLAILADEFNRIERAVVLAFLENLTEFMRGGTDKPLAGGRK